ncbi:MAG: DUF4199 domain-containing protein [Flavobacteriaceae bacterium]
MENNTNSTKNIALNYGLTLGFTTILISVITYIMDMPLETGWISGLLGIVVMIALIVLGIKKYKTGNGGFISLSQALKVGIAIALIGGIIGSIYQLVFLSYIDPEYLSRVQELQIEQALENNPEMSNEQIQMMREMGSKFSSPWISFAGALIGNLLFGFIFSLIGGLILKKNEDSI